MGRREWEGVREGIREKMLPILYLKRWTGLFQMGKNGEGITVTGDVTYKCIDLWISRVCTVGMRVQ